MALTPTIQNTLIKTSTVGFGAIAISLVFSAPTYATTFCPAGSDGIAVDCTPDIGVNPVPPGVGDASVLSSAVITAGETYIFTFDVDASTPTFGGTGGDPFNVFEVELANTNLSFGTFDFMLEGPNGVIASYEDFAAGGSVEQFFPGIFSASPTTYTVTITDAKGAPGIGYEFDILPFSTPTPGPLPIMGAGVAFGFSRKLRRRVAATRKA